MSKTFSTMQTNVGNMVQDTSVAFAPLIGVWLNDKYQDISRRHNWSVLIDDNYTLKTVAVTAVVDEAQTSSTTSVVTITHTPIYSVTGVWLATDTAHTGTNYYTGGSYIVATGVITLGSVLAGATTNVIINYSYGTPEYTLPTDFDKEIFVADVTDGFSLKRRTEGLWWQERYSAYQAGMIQSGTSTNYIILREAGKLKLDPAPDAIHTIAMPYKKLITALTSTGTPAIADIEWIMEMGAASEACAYKKQYAKAAYYLQRYEVELARRIGQERSQVNQMYQWIPESGEFGLHRLTGDNSYDSL